MGESVEHAEIVAAEMLGERLSRRASWSALFGIVGLGLLIISGGFLYLLSLPFISYRFTSGTTEFFIQWTIIIIWTGAAISCVAAIRLGLSSMGRANKTNRSLAVAGVVLGLFVVALALLPYAMIRLNMLIEPLRGIMAVVEELFQ